MTKTLCFSASVSQTSLHDMGFDTINFACDVIKIARHYLLSENLHT